MADQDEDRRALVEKYNEALATGNPLTTFSLDEIVRILVSPAGEVSVDFVFTKGADGRDMVARLLISAQSAHTLKARLVAHEGIPDTPPAKRHPRSTN